MSWEKVDWRGRRRFWEPVHWTRLLDHDVAVGLYRRKTKYGHENRWYLLTRRWDEQDIAQQLVLAQTVITSSPGTTQTITSDATWNNASNTVEVIGGGASGAHGA